VIEISHLCTKKGTIHTSKNGVEANHSFYKFVLKDLRVKVHIGVIIRLTL
jgi:hypothetical protein